MKINPLLCTDSYKLTHPEQYPDGTEIVYSNITARASRMDGVDSVVVLGLQYFVKEYLIDQFNDNFFNRDKDEVVDELKAFLDRYLGEGVTDTQKYADLHDLGYLPLVIKSLPEGTRCPIGVPYCTIVNTDKRFFWLTNFIETLMQNTMWNPLTAATISDQYKQLLTDFALRSCDNTDHVQFQAHNFSMRGMSSFESSLTADLGHLCSFAGSDTVPGIFFAEQYYNADPSKELVSCSVPATEHSVMCAGQKADERETIRRLISETYPDGIVSIVSDTWDLWHTLTKILPSLRDEIEARDGKVVVRPDSGDPVKIICGYFVEDVGYASEYILANRSRNAFQQKLKQYRDMNTDCFRTTDGVYFDLKLNEVSPDAVKGVVQILAEQFGTTTNGKGYLELNPKVGVIYGDSITLERAFQICRQLMLKGYATNNIVFGVGSFTYQYNTRDTFSIACKATYVEINGEGLEIFKDPITDSGTKKSACGLLRVDMVDGELVLREKVTKVDEAGGMLVPVFENGKLLVETSLAEIRERLS